ncbi:amino acid permease family protein [Burkholderia sp. ABCPW 111]|nr:amino acid permease family protein [Burkholderia sp. ABCPW 111]
MNAPVERGATAAPHHAGSLTILQGTALYVGAVLGTGVIALPALAAEVAGPASLVAWAALVVLSIPLAATFAALGARYPDAGGVSTYVRNAFGPKAAAVVGWCFYFAVPAGAPAAAMFGGAYVAAVTGGGHATVIASAAVLIAIVAAANAFGVTVSGGAPAARSRPGGRASAADLSGHAWARQALVRRRCARVRLHSRALDGHARRHADGPLPARRRGAHGRVRRSRMTIRAARACIPADSADARMAA